MVQLGCWLVRTKALAAERRSVRKEEAFSWKERFACMERRAKPLQGRVCMEGQVPGKNDLHRGRVCQCGTREKDLHGSVRTERTVAW
jgi:hypothetical protein